MSFPEEQRTMGAAGSPMGKPADPRPLSEAEAREFERRLDRVLAERRRRAIFARPSLKALAGASAELALALVIAAAGRRHAISVALPLFFVMLLLMRRNARSDWRMCAEFLRAHALLFLALVAASIYLDFALRGNDAHAPLAGAFLFPLFGMLLIRILRSERGSPSP